MLALCDTPSAPLWVWERPAPDRIRYVLGVDTGAGTNMPDGREAQGDYSAAIVVNAQSGAQVAEFYSKDLGPQEFTDKVVDLASWYGKAYIVPESNGLGQAVVDRLVTEYHWPHLFRRKVYDRLIQGERWTWGFHMGGGASGTKSVLISETRAIFRKNPLLVRSSRLAKQMKAYVSKTLASGKIELGALSGEHDDLVTAFALAQHGRRDIFSPAKGPAEDLEDPYAHLSAFERHEWEQMDRRASRAKMIDSMGLTSREKQTLVENYAW